MKDVQFIERRKEHRLPYEDKVIYTDTQRSATAYAANISRGGIFVMTLDPFPIDTEVHLAFCLPSQPVAFISRAKVAHIVFDRQRCEIDCGMGFQFLDLDESQKSTLNLHILNEQSHYLNLKKLLGEARPDFAAIETCLKRMPHLEGYDLLGLRYKVNRICTIFEPAPVLEREDSQVKAAS